MIKGIWAGADVVVMATGPSLDPEDCEYVRGKAKVIVVKNAALLAPWADLLYFCDRHTFEWYPDIILGFEGMKATLDNFKLREQIPGLMCFHNVGTEGLCLDPEGLHTGRNSGYQAINLAVHTAPRRILLLGYDMGPRNGKVHFFGNHPRQVSIDTFSRNFAPRFKTMLPQLAELGIQVINCTLGSSIDCFPIVPLREALPA